MGDSNPKPRKWKTIFTSETEECDESTYVKARQKLKKINRVSRSALPIVKINNGECSCVVEEATPQVSIMKRKFEQIKEAVKSLSPKYQKQNKNEKKNLKFLNEEPEELTDYNGNTFLSGIGLDVKNKAFMKLVFNLNQNRILKEVTKVDQHNKRN